MANRYSTIAYHYHNTSTSKAEHIPIGVLRDSASQAVTQNPGLWQATPLQAGQITGVLVNWLLAYPNGYVQ